MPRLNPIIAIDGPVGSGKSTTARIVADRLGFLYIDTGRHVPCSYPVCSRTGYPAG